MTRTFLSVSVIQVLALGSLAAAGTGCDVGVAKAEGELSGSCRNTRGAYGYSCSGSVNLGQGLVPITVVGIVSGDGKGHLIGRGTSNTPLGSLPWRIEGDETIDADCFGRVVYDVSEIESPAGSGNWIKLPPAIFDFVVVDDGQEILGAEVAPGAAGDDVHRLTCRLVRVRRR